MKIVKHVFVCSIFVLVAVAAHDADEVEVRLLEQRLARYRMDLSHAERNIKADKIALAGIRSVLNDPRDGRPPLPADGGRLGRRIIANEPVCRVLRSLIHATEGKISALRGAD